MSTRRTTFALGLSLLAAAALGVALLAAVKPSIFGLGKSGSGAGAKAKGEGEEVEGEKKEGGGADAGVATSTDGGNFLGGLLAKKVATACKKPGTPMLNSRSWFEEERKLVSEQIQDRAQEVVRKNQEDAIALQRVATLISMFNLSSVTRAAQESRAHPQSVNFVFSHDLLQQTLQGHVGNIQRKAMLDSLSEDLAQGRWEKLMMITDALLRSIAALTPRHAKQHYDQLRAGLDLDLYSQMLKEGTFGSEQIAQLLSFLFKSLIRLGSPQDEQRNAGAARECVEQISRASRDEITKGGMLARALMKIRNMTRAFLWLFC